MQIAVIGSLSSTRFRELSKTVHTQYLPKVVIAGGEIEEENAPKLLEGRKMLNDLPTAFLCQQFTCKRPTSSPDELKALIDEALTHESD